MDSPVRMVLVRGAFGHDNNMAFVPDAQRLFQCAQNHFLDIGIRIRMFIDQQAFSACLVRTHERQVTGSCPHDLHKKHTAHGRARGFQRLDGLVGQGNGRVNPE